MSLETVAASSVRFVLHSQQKGLNYEKSSKVKHFDDEVPT